MINLTKESCYRAAFHENECHLTEYLLRRLVVIRYQASKLVTERRSILANLIKVQKRIDAVSGIGTLEITRQHKGSLETPTSPSAPT
jgi:hypothetical protein